MVLIPGHDAFITADPAVGLTTFTFGSGKDHSTTTKAIPVPKQGATCWIERSSKTGSYYSVDPMAAKITEIHLNEASLQGTILKQYQLTNNSGPIDAAIGTIKENE